jgi:hypothetical protein
MLVAALTAVATFAGDLKRKSAQGCWALKTRLLLECSPHTYKPINNNGAAIIVRRLIGRLTRAMDEEVLRDASRRDRLPVIHVD